MTGIVIAYDRSTFGIEDMELIEKLAPNVDLVKVGLEALTTPLAQGVSVGQAAHDFAEECGGRGFKDWKLHDIGTTMKRAFANIVGTTSAMTAHASASREGLVDLVKMRNGHPSSETKKRTLLLGVSVLTDIPAAECFATYGRHPIDQVCHFADKLAHVGFDGIVCSGLELAELKRRKLTEDLQTLVPGTRPSWAPDNDQKRVMSYQEVAALGATWTVVGRVLMNAPNRLETLARVKEELGAG